MKVPLSWGEAQLDADVDGCNHNKSVSGCNTLCHCVEVDDLQCQFTGLGRERGCYHEGSLKRSTSLPVRQLRNCWWRLNKSAPRVHLTLEIERVGDCVGTDAVVLK